MPSEEVLDQRSTSSADMDSGSASEPACAESDDARPGARPLAALLGWADGLDRLRRAKRLEFFERFIGSRRVCDYMERCGWVCPEAGWPVALAAREARCWRCSCIRAAVRECRRCTHIAPCTMYLVPCTMYDVPCTMYT